MAKYYEKEWSLESHPEWTFRYKRVSPIKLTGFSISLKDSKTMSERVETNEELIRFALENIEYKVKTEWFPVKVPGQDVYYPSVLEDDLMTTIELANKFLQEVFYPSFMKSSESQK